MATATSPTELERPGRTPRRLARRCSDLHFIVGVLDNTLLSTFSTFNPPVAAPGPGPYFDPSYGFMYSSSTDFQSQAIAGYTVELVVGPTTATAAARNPTGPNITLLPCTLDPSNNFRCN